MDILKLEGKTALVTGAAGAIGRGIAEGLCQCGTRVFITDLEASAVQKTVQAVSVTGRFCQGLAADVTAADQVQKVVAAAAEALAGRIDILVNVAGVVAQGRIEDISEEQWDHVFAVNCKGAFLFTKYVVPLMKKHQYGKIINFSSKSGKTGSALMTHYSAAKAAIMGMTQALAFELAEFNINVNCLCPGITDNTGVWANVSAGYIQNLEMPREDVVKKFTAKIPLKRLASIDDVTAVTLFLASSGADYMTGQAINVTGGREMH
ncbi:MAG: SDR family NAD(P)-dependent oxidoreductase [Planctomycetota bacterium]|jgi:NAD(P)-dependent dehydrogenase (short-subunit alcohol dehydrogenase family)